MEIPEQIARYIYLDHGHHWELLTEQTKQLYIDHHFNKNIGQFKTSSGVTVKELVDKEEENFAKREALRNL